jgi:hypothetical protein
VLQFDVLVEPNVESAVFAITKNLVSDDISLSLRTPNGDIITVADAPDPKIKVITSPNSVIFEVSEPKAGVWNMIVSAGPVTGGQFNLIAFARHDGVQLNISVESGIVEFPKPVKIAATPLFEGAAIVGGSVVGTVRRPDGSKVPITLLDDGLGPDKFPGDGIYAATFSQYNDDGTYIFDLTAVINRASTFSGEDLFISAGHPTSALPVPDFVRVANATAVVSGVPDFVVATVEYGPETINLKSKGNYVTAYIELPDGLNPSDIVINSVEITAIDGASITPIKVEASPTAIGDFDNDGTLDLMVKFNRKALQQVLVPGMRSIQLEGIVGNLFFKGERSVGVITPGK